MTPEELIAAGDYLFDKRGSLLSMWQDIAENFFLERADFTVNRTLGDSFGDHLTTSYPLLVRRSLGDAFSSMNRPKSKQWFHMRTMREDKEDQPGKAWLEYADQIMWRAIYDRNSLFVRASKQADHDIATFGQAVKSIELNREGSGLLFRTWHLRDCAWAENDEGKVSTLHRKWKPTARDLAKRFEGKVHSKVVDKLIGSNKQPYCEIQCRHIVMPADEYDGDYAGKKRGVPFVSSYLDVENKHIMEAVGQTYFMYVIPRWQTVGSQYAYSPATIIALPDARLMQSMTETLLEAGEKAVNPPMVAVQEAIRSDISIIAGGITYTDAAYDDRTGKVLDILTNDKSGLPLGLDMVQDTRGMLDAAFYISKLSLPANRPEMTAFEVGQYVQQYIREAAPVFEPLEEEDNAAVCETIFDLMMSRGGFGPYEDIPQSIRGEDIGFRFESDLHEAIERQKANKLLDGLGIVTQVQAVDETAIEHVNFGEALRDVLPAVMESKWLRSEDEIRQRREENEERDQTAQTVEDVMAAAAAAEQVGKAGAAIGPEAMAA